MRDLAIQLEDKPGAPLAAARADRPVPDALAITGWDDTDAAAAAGLTTVGRSLRDQGARCHHLALGQESEHDPPRWQVIRRRTSRTRAAT